MLDAPRARATEILSRRYIWAPANRTESLEKKDENHGEAKGVRGRCVIDRGRSVGFSRYDDAGGMRSAETRSRFPTGGGTKDARHVWGDGQGVRRQRKIRMEWDGRARWWN